MRKVVFKRFATIALFGVCILTSCIDMESDLDVRIKNDDKKIKTYLETNQIQATKHELGFYFQVLSANSAGATLSPGDVVEFEYVIKEMGKANVIETNMKNLLLINTDESCGTKMFVAQTFLCHNFSTASTTTNPAATSAETITNLPPIDHYRDEPAYLKLGSYSVIPEGLDYGMKMMRVGELYKFYIPSYLAFGDYWTDEFPSGAIFEITVKVIAKYSENQIETKQMDSLVTYMNTHYPGYTKYESGLCYIDSVAGTGSQPVDGSIVRIDFKRRYLNDELIKSSTGVQILLNSNQAVEGLEAGIKQMKEGGWAIMAMPSKLAFKHSVCIIPEVIRPEMLSDKVINSEVKPYSIIKYKVNLRSTN